MLSEVLVQCGGGVNLIIIHSFTSLFNRYIQSLVEVNQAIVAWSFIYHLQALLSWINFDLNARRGSCARLLACVRLPLLPPQYIADNIGIIVTLILGSDYKI